MIHNLQEAKLHRRPEAPSQGFDEEELMELIGQVESGGMLPAPAHLKSNVLAHIRREKQTAKKRQLFTYRAQVLIAMAAAITLLVLMPADGSRMSDPQRVWLSEQELEELQPEPLGVKAQKRQEKIDAGWTDYQEKQEKARSGREIREGISAKLKAFQVFITNNYEIWRLIS